MLRTSGLATQYTMTLNSVCLLFGLLSLAFISASGDKCRGYCRERTDCLGPTTAGNCPDGFACCNHKTDKSEGKCKEYGGHVYQESQGLALMARMLPAQQVSECHIEGVPLVVGGVKAKPQEFPHMAAIGYGNSVMDAKWLCGGSLISENFVLTAAHCSESQDSGPAKFIRLGSLNLKATDSNVQDFTIAQRINHPRYKAPSRYHDIALYKLDKPAHMSGYTRPACLHSGYNELNFKKAVATGWGKTDYHATEGIADLMKVTIDLIDYDSCNASFRVDVGGKSLRHGILPSQICAGHMAGGKDTCQGDSGGPLQVVRSDPYCMYDIIGVTSFGKFCGFKNSPAIYTKVSYYLPWIESVVWR